MFVTISFQKVRNIKAHAFLDLESAPFFVNFESVENDESGKHYSRGEFVLHLEDKELAGKLVEAINRVIADHVPKQETEALEDAAA